MSSPILLLHTAASGSSQTLVVVSIDGELCSLSTLLVSSEGLGLKNNKQCFACCSAGDY